MTCRVRILSDMESSHLPQGSDNPRSAMAVADDARLRLTASLRLPAGLLPVLAAAVAVQLGTAAVGIAQQTAVGLAILLAGLAGFLVVAALALHRFRVINGVRVDGLGSRVVLGSGATSSLPYLGALAAATWAAFESMWWLVAVSALVGGVGYALGVRQWWQGYHKDPVTYTVGVSPRLLGGLAVLACLGFVALVVVG